MKARCASGDGDSSADSRGPPSPPSKHEKWNSDESQQVAERILSKFVFMF